MTVNRREGLFRLPLELLHRILGYASIAEFLRFRSVCKRLYLSLPILEYHNKQYLFTRAIDNEKMEVVKGLMDYPPFSTLLKYKIQALTLASPLGDQDFVNHLLKDEVHGKQTTLYSKHVIKDT
jgi:hypothetical protein